MKTEPQRSADLTQLCELIEDMSVAMLTNFDDEGAMVSRPMSPLEMDVNGTLWFFTDRRSTRAEHLRVLNLSFTDPEQSTYVSLSGRGELDSDRSHIARPWTSLVKPWFPDGPDSANLTVLKFMPETAEYWDAPDSKMVRMVAMAASIVTGKSIGMGEHDTLTALSPRVPHTISA